MFQPDERRSASITRPAAPPTLDALKAMTRTVRGWTGVEVVVVVLVVVVLVAVVLMVVVAGTLVVEVEDRPPVAASADNRVSVSSDLKSDGVGAPATA